MARIPLQLAGALLARNDYDALTGHDSIASRMHTYYVVRVAEPFPVPCAGWSRRDTNTDAGSIRKALADRCDSLPPLPGERSFWVFKKRNGKKTDHARDFRVDVFCWVRRGRGEFARPGGGAGAITFCSHATFFRCLRVFFTFRGGKRRRGKRSRTRAV